jgi:hypothetical protein
MHPQLSQALSQAQNTDITTSVERHRVELGGEVEPRRARRGRVARLRQYVRHVRATDQHAPGRAWRGAH